MSHPRASHSQPYSLLEAKWHCTLRIHTRVPNTRDKPSSNLNCGIPVRALQGCILVSLRHSTRQLGRLSRLLEGIVRVPRSSEWQGARWNLSARNVVEWKWMCEMRNKGKCKMRDPVTTTRDYCTTKCISAAAMDVPCPYSSRQASSRAWTSRSGGGRSLLRSGNGRRAKLKESSRCFGQFRQRLFLMCGHAC